MPVKTRRRPVSTDRRFRNKQNVSDYGPAERWQHATRVLQFTEKAGILAARVLEEHIVDIMVTRGLLNPRQRDAALKFKFDYVRAKLDATATSNYTPLRQTKNQARREHERNDAEEAAYQRWRNALGALGLIFSDAVISVACHDKLPTPHEVPTLQNGLERLAKWYRLPEATSDKSVKAN